MYRIFVCFYLIFCCKNVIASIELIRSALKVLKNKLHFNVGTLFKKKKMELKKVPRKIRPLKRSNVDKKKK